MRIQFLGISFHIPFDLIYVIQSDTTPYLHLGCWKDAQLRAVPTLEGSDPRLVLSEYPNRKDAIKTCFEVARERQMMIFAVQDGGWCAADDNLDGYKRYGLSTQCKDGKGGQLTNDVYRITHSNGGK